jgi:hypothetical protein
MISLWSFPLPQARDPGKIFGEILRKILGELWSQLQGTTAARTADFSAFRTRIYYFYVFLFEIPVAKLKSWWHESLFRRNAPEAGMEAGLNYGLGSAIPSAANRQARRATALA